MLKEAARVWVLISKEYDTNTYPAPCFRMRRVRKCRHRT